MMNEDTTAMTTIQSKLLGDFQRALAEVDSWDGLNEVIDKCFATAHGILFDALPGYQAKQVWPEVSKLLLQISMQHYCLWLEQSMVEPIQRGIEQGKPVCAQITRQVLDGLVHHPGVLEMASMLAKRLKREEELALGEPNSMAMSTPQLHLVKKKTPRAMYDDVEMTESAEQRKRRRTIDNFEPKTTKRPTSSSSSSSSSSAKKPQRSKPRKSRTSLAETKALLAAQQQERTSKKVEKLQGAPDSKKRKTR